MVLKKTASKTAKKAVKTTAKKAAAKVKKAMPGWLNAPKKVKTVRVEAAQNPLKDLNDQREDSKIIAGLIILRRYIEDDDGYHVNAEHDVIYAGPDSADDVSSEDAEKLVSLGWTNGATESGRWGIFL